MWGSHSPRRGRYNIERRPQGLHDLAVYSGSALNEVGRIPNIAAVLMAVHMPQPYPRIDVQTPWERYMPAVLHPESEVLVILAVDVIEGHGATEAVGVIAQSIAERIVHIHLPA